MMVPDWPSAALGFALGVLLVAPLAAWLAGRGRISRARHDMLASSLQAAMAETEKLKAELCELREKTEARLAAAMADVLTAREQAARLDAEKKAGEALVAQQRADLKNMDEKLRLQFENLANRIFDEKTASFKKASEEGLGQMLAPLRERLQEFQKKVDESFGTQAREQFSLRKEIERIILSNEKITLQAENLASALKGDSKVQGDWGEVTLQRILEESGLRRDTDYRAQMHLRDGEGNSARPDFVVLLPEKKHVVLDSKVSLTHYESYFNAGDDTARGQALRQFLSSVRQHVNDLEKRRYQDTESLGAPDFVLMFMPTEGSYALAIQQDAALHGYAWEKRVAIVGPATLFVTLRTIASLWRVETQNRNALEIARQGGALYDKIAGFVEDMRLLESRIGATQKAYDEAWKKLSGGQGNILKRTQDLKALGVKASKSLPAEALQDEDGLLPAPQEQARDVA